MAESFHTLRLAQVRDDLATVRALARKVRSTPWTQEGITQESSEALSRVLALFDRLETELVEMVAQHCTVSDGHEDLSAHGRLDARGLSANRDAMQILADMGLLEITGGVGRCITGKWVKKDASHG